ncbi:DUF4179 domain-containing protein [Clostridium thailandense]|uniref:DUF4179 domain-containing protein n=1 Tax=Clostridium thailandense TaxID=2794346 RepID=UPI0039895A80
MNNIEKLLNEKKLEFDKLDVPESLESRLRISLENKNIKIRNNKFLKIKIATIFICFILIGYNFNTLGFYSEKLTGYDKLMDANLKKLNELGKGQTVNKSFTFKNGLVFILDGIMVDNNRLIVFYTIKAPSGNIEDTSIDLTMSGKFSDEQFHSSYGTTNGTKTELKAVANFDPPSAFDKYLVLSIIPKESSEIGRISFTLDKNKAIGHSIKKFLNKTIEIDDINLRLQYISASPTTTIIKGKLKSTLELAIDRLRGITFSSSGLDIKLIADGKIIENQEAKLSSNIDGVNFKYNFKTLPPNFKKLQVQLCGLTSEHIVNKKFKLKKGIQNENINIENKNVKLEKVYESNGNTYVTFSTDSDIILTKVNMLMDGKFIELNKTIRENSKKLSNTRTLEFHGTGNNLELNIERMLYRTNYNKIIDIISN